MLRAVIADDEADSAASLRSILEASGRVRVVGEATNGSECVRLLSSARPDVLFTGVTMPGLPSPAWVQALGSLPHPPFVVFVTASAKLAVQAFEVGATDFLVKGSDAAGFERRIATTLDRLEKAIAQRCSSRGGRGADHRSSSPPATFASSESGRPALLPVRDAGTGVIRLLDARDIVCARRNGRRVEILTTRGAHSTYYTIERLSARLGPHGFVLASRSRVVNVARISHLVPNGDGSYDAVMDDRAHTTVTVSRHNAQRLIQALQP